MLKISFFGAGIRDTSILRSHVLAFRVHAKGY